MGQSPSFFTKDMPLEDVNTLLETSITPMFVNGTYPNKTIDRKPCRRIQYYTYQKHYGMFLICVFLP